MMARTTKVLEGRLPYGVCNGGDLNCNITPLRLCTVGCCVFGQGAVKVEDDPDAFYVGLEPCHITCNSCWNELLTEIVASDCTYCFGVT